jgi:23S rRNA (adenine2030-N6)-methyltransferase
MLSYRHGFHAGNFADVLKHLVQIAILQYLKKKATPFYYHDTHAGSGSYNVSHPYMQKNREYLGGITRIWESKPVSPLLKEYLALVRQLNPTGELLCYPGSPEIAVRLLRHMDRAWFGEKHTTDFRILSTHYRKHPGVHCEMMDAWQGLKAKLPPKEHRGLILIDPSYELESDYRQLTRALEDALQRFALGTYAIWYPVIDERTTDKLLRRFAALPVRDNLHIHLDLGKEKSEPGMHACGMFVINPPFTLADTMKQTMPELLSLLADNKKTGRFLIEKLKVENG